LRFGIPADADVSNALGSARFCGGEFFWWVWLWEISVVNCNPVGTTGGDGASCILGEEILL